MEQHKEDIGTNKDLVFYRLQTAKSDLKSARILLAAEEYKGANNRAYYAIFHASDYIASKEESERQVAVADDGIDMKNKIYFKVGKYNAAMCLFSYLLYLYEMLLF